MDIVSVETVGELKEALREVDDDTSVYIYYESPARDDITKPFAFRDRGDVILAPHHLVEKAQGLAREGDI